MPIIFILDGIFLILNIFGVIKFKSKSMQMFCRCTLIFLLLGYITPYVSLSNIAFNIFHIISMFLIIAGLSFFVKNIFIDFVVLVILSLSYYFLITIGSFDYLVSCLYFILFVIIFLLLYNYSFLKCLCNIIMLCSVLNVLLLYVEFSEYGFVLLNFNIVLIVFQYLVFGNVLIKSFKKLSGNSSVTARRFYEKKDFFDFNFISFNIV